jgi:hypothetical protein
MKFSTDLIIATAAFGAICLAGYLLPFTPIRLREVGVGDVTTLLSSLVVVALLMERALEVFICVWRDPKAAELELILKHAQEDLQANAGNAELKASVQRAQLSLTTYTSETKVIAMRAGFLLGLLISLFGIRALFGLIQPDSLAAASEIQRHCFNVLDVFVTGGVIAGGSDGIHKIMALYTEFMQQTTNRVAGRP